MTMKYGMILHLGLGMAVLLGGAFFPRPGHDVLLVPLWPLAATAGALAAKAGPQASRPGAPFLLGTGRPAGSLILRPPRPLPVLALLWHGILPIAVPARACGGRRS